MNQTLTQFVLDAFDRAMRSPIGCVIANQYQSITPPLPADIDIFLLRQKLIERSQYQNPESFLENLNVVISNSCRFFGPESDISVALLSIQHSIILSLHPIIGISQHNSVKWEQSKQTLFTNLIDFSRQLPNDLYSYKAFTEEIQRTPYIDTENHVKYPQPNINLNLFELKSKIERIQDDLKTYELSGIIEHYQPELAGSVGNLRFDLKLCNPHTLYLINEFVNKCKFDPPIWPSSSVLLHRSNSTPLKNNTGSSTIVLANPLHNKSPQEQLELQHQQQMLFQNQLQSTPIQQQGQIISPSHIENHIPKQTHSTGMENMNQLLENINSYNLNNKTINTNVIQPSIPLDQTIDLQMVYAPSSAMMSNISVQPSTNPTPAAPLSTPKKSRQTKQKKLEKRFDNSIKEKSGELSLNTDKSTELTRNKASEEKDQSTGSISNEGNSETERM